MYNIYLVNATVEMVIMFSKLKRNTLPHTTVNLIINKTY